MRDSYEHFKAALQYFLEKQGRGIQKALATKLKVSQRHISEIKHGRANASVSLQGKIAAYFGMSFEDFIALGKWILDGGDPEEWMELHRGRKIVKPEKILQEYLFPDYFTPYPPLSKKARLLIGQINNTLCSLPEEDILAVYKQVLERKKLYELEERIEEIEKNLSKK